MSSKSSTATVSVFVPSCDSLKFLDPGSAIIGVHRDDGATVDIWFESNRYDAANIITFADKLAHAHGRHVTAYPTSARSVVALNDLVHVGTFDPATGICTLANETSEHILSEFLGSTISAKDLQTSSGAF